VWCCWLFPLRSRSHVGVLLPGLHHQSRYAVRIDFLDRILVDDAIVVVENMVRHFRLPENHGRPMSEVAVEAVAEVGNPHSGHFRRDCRGIADAFVRV